MKRPGVVVVIAIALWSCGGKSSYRSTPKDRQAAERAVAELAAGRFDLARSQAENTLISYRDNSSARAVRAVARYESAIRALFETGGRVIDAAEDSHGKSGFDHPRMRAALDTADKELGEVLADLAVASRDLAFELELCPACWRRDWNGSGDIDDRDLAMLEVEYDATGTEIARGDPRRRPTFRFDAGDLQWAIAMVSFQRAAIEIILGFDWRDLDKLVLGGGGLQLRLTIRVADAARLRHARELILSGLDATDRARKSYLAETDDDREWVPSPRQHNQGLPLPVDDAIYATWAAVVDDVRDLMASDTGISFDEVPTLVGEAWPAPPGGYLDLGAMLSRPRDFTIDVAALAGASYQTREGARTLCRTLFGDYYVDRMKASPLIGRLVRMRGDLDRGNDTFERKLRYFLWLN